MTDFINTIKYEKTISRVCNKLGFSDNRDFNNIKFMMDVRILFHNKLVDYLNKQKLISNISRIESNIDKIDNEYKFTIVLHINTASSNGLANNDPNIFENIKKIVNEYYRNHRY